MNIKNLVIYALGCLASVLGGSACADEGKSAFTLEVEPVEIKMSLVAEGTIPSWLSGALIRNSAIPIHKDGKQVSHMFDGLAMLQKCRFNEGKVDYMSRYINSQEYVNVMVDGNLEIEGFGTVPSEEKSKMNQENEINNASVNVFSYDKSLVALTEAPLPVRFDGNTLQTLGSYLYRDSLPKGHCWESAHPHYDADKKELINYLIEFGVPSHYVVYRMKDGARQVIAKVPVERSSYMHSFAVTKNYVIFTEFPLLLNPQDLMDWTKPFIHKFQWLPEKGTHFLVIDRHSGRLVLQRAVDPIFSFHHANAYEAGDNIVVDLVAYPDLSSMPEIFPQAKLGTYAQQTWKNKLIRYQISLKEGKIATTTLLEAEELEFPRFDDRLDGKSYRYLYLTHSDKKAKGGLAKLDLATKKVLTWNAAPFEALEPVFVPKPLGTSEDEGVVLSIMNDKSQNLSYLVVLDGKTFVELARAKLPAAITTSFHGQFFDESFFEASE